MRKHHGLNVIDEMSRRDSALLYTIIFTNLPSLHPFSFHEMIFILVPPVFLELAHFVRSSRARAIARPKM